MKKMKREAESQGQSGGTLPAFRGQEEPAMDEKKE